MKDDQSKKEYPTKKDDLAKKDDPSKKMISRTEKDDPPKRVISDSDDEHLTFHSHFGKIAKMIKPKPEVNHFQWSPVELLGVHTIVYLMFVGIC